MSARAKTVRLVPPPPAVHGFAEIREQIGAVMTSLSQAIEAEYGELSGSDQARLVLEILSRVSTFGMRPEVPRSPVLTAQLVKAVDALTPEYFPPHGKWWLSAIDREAQSSLFERQQEARRLGVHGS